MGLHAKWDRSRSDWSEVMQQKLVTESGEIWGYATKIVDVLLKGQQILQIDIDNHFSSLRKDLGLLTKLCVI